MSLWSRLFDRDEETGLTTIFHAEEDGGYTLETVQDVESVLEYNKAVFNGIDERARYTEWNHKARIPLVIWEMWSREGDLNDPDFLKKKLNDRENQFLLTRPGRL